MMKNAAWFLSLALLGAGLPGCGGGSSTTAPVPPPTVPPPPVTTLIEEGNFSGLEARVLTAVPFDTVATGTIEATVDWTFATDNVEVYLVRGTCTVDQFNNLTCPFVAFSESPTAKPERIRATNQAPGSFNLYIGNRGPAEEAVSFQIFLTTGGSGASATTTRVIRGGRGESYARMISHH
jgi:hypothetical protein